MSVTNYAFLLANVATPIDSVYSMHNHVLSAHMQQIIAYIIYMYMYMHVMSVKDRQNVLNNSRYTVWLLSTD
jgi:hypothetical protein